MTRKHNISGNVLVFILIAIFLLGGLTVFLARGSGQTEETGEAERTSVQASELMTWAAGLAGAVDRLSLNGCGENQISFDDNLATTGGYENIRAPSNYSCHVFMPQGGGMTNKTQKTAWLDSAQSSAMGYGLNFYTGNISVMGVGTDIGDAGKDLVLIVPYVKRELCADINRRLGVSVIPQDNGPFDPGSGSYAARKFTGANYTLTDRLGDESLPNSGLIVGKKALCIQATLRPVANTYHFFQVLKVR